MVLGGKSVTVTTVHRDSFTEFYNVKDIFNHYILFGQLFTNELGAVDTAEETC